MQCDPSPDDLRTRLLEIACARARNAAAIVHATQQLFEIRGVIRRDLEPSCPEGQSSTVEWQAQLKHLDELLLQDVSIQEELGSQIEAGLAITVTLQSVLMDMHGQGLDVSDLLTRIDQILPREA